MKVEVLIPDITKLTTSTRLDPDLVTTIKFDCKVQVASLARILNLQRQGAPMMVSISSPQATMDLAIEEERAGVNLHLPEDTEGKCHRGKS
jgi:hypothetical protein